MKALFLSKKEKPLVEDAINIANEFFDNLTVCFGDIEDEFPNELMEYSYDVIISYLSPWIIPKEVLGKTSQWNINFHPGPPEFPGIGCFNFAIYQSAKEFGATAHIMNQTVDSGEIIGVKRFAILDDETVESLSVKTYVSMFQLYEEIMKYISDNNSLPKSAEKWQRVPYKRSELEDLCRISKNMDVNEIKRRIQATYYKGKPGPFIQIADNRFEYNPDR